VVIGEAELDDAMPKALDVIGPLAEVEHQVSLAMPRIKEGRDVSERVAIASLDE